MVVAAGKWHSPEGLPLAKQLLTGRAAFADEQYLATWWHCISLLPVDMHRGSATNSLLVAFHSAC